ncbi:UDP-N-acetylglucosamine 2-epimerase (non-hydrolyzing) [bacterium]|nr:UDP-N-acetylglucosamine 2-epimerase (non-hydrolyzing) [bacterium]
MTSPRFMLSCGTRPEIIKIAPVYRALRERNAEVILAFTGQHWELAEKAFQDFGLKPDIRFEATYPEQNDQQKQHGASNLTYLGARLLTNCGNILDEVLPSVVVVQGDTSSTLMMALAAFYRKISVAHVEAGLRTHRRCEPFPEETNRALVAQLAETHFAPTERARQNLLREGIADQSIYVVGNTVIDAMQIHGGQLPLTPSESRLQDSISQRLHGRRLIMATGHRRENQRSAIGEVARQMRRLLDVDDRVLLVWPLHPNREIVRSVTNAFEDLPSDMFERCVIVPSVSYGLMQWLIRHSWLTITDSGGVLEEATAIHRPVLVFRSSTERDELVESGAAFLVSPSEIVDAYLRLDQDEQAYTRMTNAPYPYGEGDAAEHIADVLCGRR